MRQRQQVVLDGGRKLCYDDHGPVDGVPLIYCHGAPGARVEWDCFVPEALVARMGVRVLSVDRPGMGRSGFQPHRRVLDWPDDVAALADALGLDRFAVLGFSGGCPVAAACAYRLPGRVTALGIVDGVVADDAPLPDGERDAKVAQSQHLAKDHPRLARVVFGAMRRIAQVAPGMVVKQALGVFPPPDQTLLRDAAFQRCFIAMFREAHRQGTRGSVQDQALMVSPWGFDLGAITVPTHIWVGEDDRHAPPAMARYLADTIPGARLHSVPGEGHMSTFARRAPEILETTVTTR